MNDYVRFHDQAFMENGELIKEAMMVELETINHVQILQDENWKAAMIE